MSGTTKRSDGRGRRRISMHVRSPEHLEERLFDCFRRPQPRRTMMVTLPSKKRVRADRRDADGAQREERGRRHEERAFVPKHLRSGVIVDVKRRRLVLVDRGEEQTTALVVRARAQQRVHHHRRQRERESVVCGDFFWGENVVVKVQSSSRGKKRRENFSRGKNEEEKKRGSSEERVAVVQSHCVQSNAVQRSTTPAERVGWSFGVFWWLFYEKRLLLFIFIFIVSLSLSRSVSLVSTVIIIRRGGDFSKKSALCREKTPLSCCSYE